MRAGVWQAKQQAMVLRSLESVDPLGSEIIERLQAIIPAITAQVAEAFGNGNPCRSSADLLEPDRHLMHTAAKHEFSKPFVQLHPQLVCKLRRGGRQSSKSQEFPIPPLAPQPLPQATSEVHAVAQGVGALRKYGLQLASLD